MGNSPRQSALGAPLTLPFAVLGLCGGAIVADRLGNHFSDGPGGVLVTLATGLVAGRLGWLLSRSEPEGPVIEPWWVRVSVRSVVAGGLNGVMVLFGLVMAALLVERARPSGGLMFAVPAAAGAWIFGALVSISFVPSLLVVAGLWERARRARPGSQVHAVLRSATWLAATLLVLVHGVLAVRVPLLRFDEDGAVGRSHHGVGPLLFVVATAAAYLAAQTVASALSLRASLRLASSLARRGPGHAGMAVVHAPRCADLGLGDEEWVEVREGDDPYRDPTRAVVRVLGNRAEARRLVQDGALWLVVALPVVSLLSLGWLSYFQ